MQIAPAIPMRRVSVVFYDNFGVDFVPEWLIAKAENDQERFECNVDDSENERDP
jgi:hypothetical protein